jgi:hypothetical protein
MYLEVIKRTRARETTTLKTSKANKRPGEGIFYSPAKIIKKAEKPAR